MGDDRLKQGNLLMNIIDVTRLKSSRVTGDDELAAQQNEDAGCYGKQCQNCAQAAHRNERGQARKDEPDG